MRCIFCKQSNVKFNTMEHAVPESLGGGDWSVLPQGLVCDGCQNYFGTKVERDALADQPLLMARTLLSLPTKKGRAPWLDDPFEGRIEAAGRSGLVHYEPAPHFANAATKTVMRFLAEPRNPRAVCRFLVKMGIEAIALESPDDALQEQYDAARSFARTGGSGTKWWYLDSTESVALTRWFVGNTLPRNEPLVELSVHEPVPGAETVLFKLGPVTLIAPLKANIYPQISGLPESPPEWRTYVV